MSAVSIANYSLEQAPRDNASLKSTHPNAIRRASQKFKCAARTFIKKPRSEYDSTVISLGIFSR